MENVEKVQKFSEAIARIKQEIRKDVVGQQEVIDNVIIAIVAGGNVLLEGVPGVGKTRLVRTLGQTLSLPFSRIQFTPDLMPSDVTGTNIVEKDDNGKLFVAVVNEAQTAYNALSDGAKKNVSDDSKNLLAKYQKAIEMANLYEKLDGIREDNVDKESFRDEYESVKTQIEEFKASDDYSSVSAYIGKNRLWNYQKAVSLFAAE
jgi:ATPase subunit of ABC transporter with duplicated ATPase domains